MTMKNCEDCDNEGVGNSSGYEDSHVVLTKGRTIFISEDVTNKMASQVAALLLHYNHEDHMAPIEIFINSNGGAISGLFNIYDIMQMIEAPIKTVCIGRCYSAAAVILAAGTKGERYGMKNCRLMVHGIQAVWPIPGLDPAGSHNYHHFLKENNDNVMKILAAHTGQDLEIIRKDCLDDVWMNANDAKRYGIIDHII
jgi:ATP-dependent Clp protease protease subunit